MIYGFSWVIIIYHFASHITLILLYTVLPSFVALQCGEKGHYANMVSQLELRSQIIRFVNLLFLSPPPAPMQCPKSFRAMQLGLVGTQQQIASHVGVK